MSWDHSDYTRTLLTQGKSWSISLPSYKWPHNRADFPQFSFKVGVKHFRVFEPMGETHETRKHSPVPEMNSPMNHCPRTTLQKINIPEENQDIKIAKQARRPTCGPWQNLSGPLSTRLRHQIHYYVLRFYSAWVDQRVWRMRVPRWLVAGGRMSGQCWILKCARQLGTRYNDIWLTGW